MLYVKTRTEVEQPGWGMNIKRFRTTFLKILKINLTVGMLRFLYKTLGNEDKEARDVIRIVVPQVIFLSPFIRWGSTTVSVDNNIIYKHKMRFIEIGCDLLLNRCGVIKVYKSLTLCWSRSFVHSLQVIKVLFESQNTATVVEQLLNVLYSASEIFSKEI